MSQDVLTLTKLKQHETVPASTKVRASRAKNIPTERLIRRLHWLKVPANIHSIAYNADGRPALRHYAREVFTIERVLVNRGVIDPFAYEYRQF